MRTTIDADGSPRGSARERLLAAASDLFYAEGINVTGVDRVASTAGVTKATLYYNFGSKEELVAACLRRQLDAWIATTSAMDHADAAPAIRVGRLFDALETDALNPEYHGCPFTNAAVEMRESAAVMAVVHEYRDRLGALVRAMLGAGRTDAADAVVYLYDGAIAAVKTTGDRSHIRRARDAALRTLA
ncbi:TetR/AcrR family transcriptional regulator [Microbacterium awajiense]|uniref:TetR/AcrR family transcriptional regulator n=1 Tax=Microbacterium awajiense TaxID=415214 RepID=A0ABP7B046_9MICO